uniref:propanoyl-CoA C-acyltransferase n=1 Tax=Rhinopithecus bieti TaxID=61621 RepID=A0A2K6K0C6_RHIBE
MSSSPWEPAPLRRVFVVGVGMTKFMRPGAENSRDYPDLAGEAGDSTCGQRAIYHSLGMTGIPIINVNNNCSTGSTALFMARQLIQGGVAECVLALGFEKMSKGSLGIKFSDRTIPTDKHLDLLINKYGLSAHPVAPQMFGYAGKEHMEKYVAISHSVTNIYFFQDEYSLDEVMASKKVFDFLTILQCCPTSDGAAAAILASEAFVQKYGLQSKAVEILAQEMMTDLPSSFEEKSVIKMKFVAIWKSYKSISFVLLLLLTFVNIIFSSIGQGATLVDRGDNTYGGKWVINPSGGLISKGHPLGATGLAQCAELCWQLRGEAGKRQVPGAKVALQHNLGLGGAVVVTLYKMGFPEATSSFRTHQIEAAPTNSASDGFKANLVFKEIEKKLEEEGEQFVKKIGGIFAFKVKDGPGGKEATWVVDVKNGKGSFGNDFISRSTDKFTKAVSWENGGLPCCSPKGLAFNIKEPVNSREQEQPGQQSKTLS